VPTAHRRLEVGAAGALAALCTSGMGSQDAPP